MMKKSVCLLLVTVWIWSCSQKNETEIHQKKRDNIINVHDKIREIQIEEVEIGHISKPHIINDYLLLKDYYSWDKQVHLFNKNNFHYLLSFCDKGEGPGEITRIGHIAPDENRNIIYVTDMGRNNIFSFHMDSVINNRSYMPEIKARIKKDIFPLEYEYVNDTLCYGTLMEPTGDYGFNESIGTWNMVTGEIKIMKYKHPEIEKKRVNMAISLEQGIYVEVYNHHDLFSICTLDGELIHNIYGRKWDNTTSNTQLFFEEVAISNNIFIAMYGDGKDRFPPGEDRGSFSTQFIIFDLNGNYLKTLETGYKLINFCYDKDNHRLIINMDGMIQFGYLELEDLI